MSAPAELTQTTLDEAADRAALERTWAEPPGFVGWLKRVDHRSIGKRYIATAFVFFVLAGVLALMMRLQLAVPDNHLLGPDKYDQFFSVHGTAMMFLFAVPVMEAMAVYLVPLMVGTRNIAFPRLNAFSYWVYLFGGAMLFVALLLDAGPDIGWFNYVPLSGPEYSPGKRSDFWSQLITFTEISALAVSVELVVTIFKLRAPGMSLNRIPLFVWSMLITSFMIIFAMPSIVLDSTMLILDRLVGTHFFNPAEGGDPLLWQHLFWFFGHPEVYIIFIPALGMVSSIISTFARRPVFGYLGMVLALVATGVIGFGLWVHHMFATGLPPLGMSFFTAASMMIAIPSGLQIFCWIATLWDGEIRFATPLLFVVGFFFIFIIGGMSGVMLAAMPIDWQVHDSFFVVAHFHYVLIGGAVFPLLGGICYWFPKMTGRMLSERAGKWSFWLFFVGFNIAFFPMHQLGLDGMPRRIYTYSADTGWGPLNLLSTLGAVVIAASLLVMIWNIVRSARSGAPAGDNPWGAATLEWATSSPPPPYNFLYIPTVNSAYPLWERDTERPVVAGMPTDERSVLITRLHDAQPDQIEFFPTPTLWPLVSAIATTIMLIGSIFTPWAVVWGAIPVAIGLTGWFWPSRKETLSQLAHEVKP
jgi:cytochrome c oxidase subunit 1